MKRLGILGSGQLAQMLALQAWPLGVQPCVLADHEEDPAWLVSQKSSIGSTQSKKDVSVFAKSVDLLTFESELIPSGVLQGLKEIASFPSVENLILLQNRATQKQTLLQYGLPTSEFLVVNDWSQLQAAVKKLNGPCVLKKSFGGYDGYGTYPILKASELPRLQALFPENFILERWVKFKRELAITAVRSSAGETIFYPFVQTQQTDHRCDWVFGPVKVKKGLALQKKIQRMLQALNYVGAITFELFETSKQELLVNEIAPRVHNSAHVTQDAFDHCQFEMHLRAGLGLPLPTPKMLSKAYAMANLLGEAWADPPYPTAAHVHWYHKRDRRNGRKMGHLNFLGDSGKSVLQKALHERKLLLRGFK